MSTEIEAPPQAPDVWWGSDGIDALFWADGIPYEFDGAGA